MEGIRHDRREIRQILEIRGRPEALDTEEARLSMTFGLVINLKTAKQLSLTISPHSSLPSDRRDPLTLAAVDRVADETVHIRGHDLRTDHNGAQPHQTARRA